MRSNVVERLKTDFQSEGARYAFVEDSLNAIIAAQIKSLREARVMSQQDLADIIGTKQSGISRLENVNYDSWKVDTLRKLARAFGVRLRISFEEFGSLIPEIENFAGRLAPRKFEEDPIFNLKGHEREEAEVATAMSPAEKNLREQTGGGLTAEHRELLRQRLEGRARAGTLLYDLPIKLGEWNIPEPHRVEISATGLSQPLPETFTRAVEAHWREIAGRIAEYSSGYTGLTENGQVVSEDPFKGLRLVPKANVTKAANQSEAA
jgi:transcriptional regulator with XRE-family HTH domain